MCNNAMQVIASVYITDTPKCGVAGVADSMMSSLWTKFQLSYQS